MRTLLAAGLAAALLACGCSRPQQPSEPDPQTAMIAILDSLATAASAELIGEVTWYDADSLHEYVDGGDVTYLKCGFVRLAHSEWRAPGEAQGKGYVDVDIYDMGSPEGALDLFSHPRSQWAEFLDIGNEAQRTNDGIEVRVGRYFARLTARREVAAERALVESLARALAAAAPPGQSDAQLMAPLPATGLRPHTATYFTKGFLGRPFIEKVREASYDVQGGRLIQMFVIDADSPELAQKLFDDWKATVPTPPIGVAASVDRLDWTESLIGPVVLVRQGRWLAGTIGDPMAARVLFDSLLLRLQ